MRSNLGVIAYGSLIDDPGHEIKAATVEMLREIETPFRVEYARSSKNRGNAQTLIPVEMGGASVKSAIHVLRPDVSLEAAKNWLWRREVRKYCEKDQYREKVKPGINCVVVGGCANVGGLETVLYTVIGATISPLTGEERHAVLSNLRGPKRRRLA